MIHSPYIFTHIRRQRVSHAPGFWKYLRFVRAHPCCACGSSRWVEAAHTGGRGLNQKTDCTQCVPLCAGCHRVKQGSLHQVGPGKFQVARGIYFKAVIAELQEEYGLE